MLLARRLPLLLAALVVLLAATASGQGWPVAANSTVVLNSSHNPVSICVLPNGTGTPLSACYGPGGVPASATISVTLFDAAGQPCANVPVSDIRLEHVGSPMSWCPNAFYPPPPHAPNCADQPTNNLGQTQFTMAYHGGGHQFMACQVWVLEASGAYMPIPGPLGVGMNSPDLNGDLIVNLSDVAMFASDMGSGTAPYRSDFNFDGAINLSDIVVFAQALGVTCP